MNDKMDITLKLSQMDSAEGLKPVPRQFKIFPMILRFLPA
jgi:hypothetical protein